MAAPVLIFGATGAIGSATARLLVTQGSPVHLAARDSEALASLAAELSGLAGADTLVSTSICDVEDDGSLEAAVAAAGPQLSGLVFAVGSIQLAPLRRQHRDVIRSALELNAVSAAMAVRAAEAPLKAAGGSVVLFSSIAVAQGFTNHVAISAAKGAVEGLTRALAADLAPKVRVNAIAPSLTRSMIAQPLTANAQMADAIAALHPIPRLGEGADAAALAAFLVGPASGWITGQVFSVDGGRSRVRTKG
jgi:NAD(P)-dependent dehydrogenase (short-subunit alcohol dehydrogenase family)